MNSICAICLLLWISLAESASARQEQTPEHPRLVEALAAASDKEFERAFDLVALAEAEGALASQSSQVTAQIERLRNSERTRLESTFQAALSVGDVSAAQASLLAWIALGVDQATVTEARQAIENLIRYGQYQPGQVFSDTLLMGDIKGPAMVVIPQGQFMMGSVETEPDRRSSEGPRHRITIEQGFAISQYEISVGEFGQFVEATRYVTDAERRNQGTVYSTVMRRIMANPQMHWRLDYLGQPAERSLPVIHVSWRDAKAYVDWLSLATGEHYRLPTEAEFEYVLRAGSQRRFPWGEDYPSLPVANLAGANDSSPNGATWPQGFTGYQDGHWGPASQGQYPSNGLGVHDMAGNVMEWTEDCWHDSYIRAPSNGAAWVNPGCKQRVVRGGSWASTPAIARSAFRMAMSEEASDVRVGFRIVRALSHE